jgi:serine phosphatase RsbU (regulator of sigma subunit)
MREEQRLEDRLRAIAIRIWPELGNMTGLKYIEGLANVTGFLYTAPLALAGLVWLAAVTDAAQVCAEWPMLGLLFLLLLLSDWLSFFFFVEIAPGTYNDFSACLDTVITWSVALILGPIALWPTVLYRLAYYARRWFRSRSDEERWSYARNGAFNLTEALTSLIALAVYQHWAGGSFPLPGLDLDAVLPALLATFAWWLLPVLAWLPLLAFFGRRRTPSGLTESSREAYIRFWTIALGWPALVGSFAILAAGLHSQDGLGVYLVSISGLLLASWLAHHLSQAVERSQQRSRELEKLEQLGRAILNAPPDASTLPDVLKEHVSDMFPFSLIEIRLERDPLFPTQTLLHHLTHGIRSPRDQPLASPPAWEWLRTRSDPLTCLPGETLPWEEQPTSDGVVVAPILDVESGEPIGGIFVSRGWRPETIESILPAVQSLAAQIGSALYGARVYAQTLAHQRVEQELTLAWRIQESFLPDRLPDIPGWQLAATLEPARETSGDFYDLFLLPNGRLGILIADVADKGMASALYMALSRTLIRTYAAEYDTQPELVLTAANRRILLDTRADLFVTVFYGILDPATGTLVYCNAGHNPPYLFGARNRAQQPSQNGDAVKSLRRTGMALGVLEDAIWQQQDAQIDPGDALVLYTDGITDAQNAQGEFFGEQRLLEVVRAKAGAQTNQGPAAGQGPQAQDIEQAVKTKIRRFVGDAPQYDDITMIVVVRG